MELTPKKSWIRLLLLNLGDFFGDGKIQVLTFLASSSDHCPLVLSIIPAPQHRFGKYEASWSSYEEYRDVVTQFCLGLALLITFSHLLLNKLQTRMKKLQHYTKTKDRIYILNYVN